MCGKFPDHLMEKKDITEKIISRLNFPNGIGLEKEFEQNIFELFAPEYDGFIGGNRVRIGFMLEDC
jgi:hypothetical protein